MILDFDTQPDDGKTFSNITSSGSYKIHTNLMVYSFTCSDLDSHGYESEA